MNTVTGIIAAILLAGIALWALESPQIISIEPQKRKVPVNRKENNRDYIARHLGRWEV